MIASNLTAEFAQGIFESYKILNVEDTQIFEKIHVIIGGNPCTSSSNGKRISSSREYVRLGTAGRYGKLLYNLKICIKY